jgi:dihydropteroate synthase
MRLTPRRWRLRDRILADDVQPIIVGIVNVTPDSFSDGGRFLASEEAVAHGRRLFVDGADLVDVGGESTRPGSFPVDADEELRRVLPVVRALANQDIPVSIDTSKAVVAEAALEAGAVAVNDVTALSDPGMADVVAYAGAGLVLIHMQGEPRTMQDDPFYEDVVREVAAFLAERASVAETAGIVPEAICLDPGIGFGKTLDHNLELLAHLDVIAGLGYPVLVGTSRKGFLGSILDEPDPEGRDIGTAAAVAVSVVGGAFGVRVHNVAVCRDAARVGHAIVRSGPKRE